MPGVRPKNVVACFEKTRVSKHSSRASTTSNPAYLESPKIPAGRLRNPGGVQKGAPRIGIWNWNWRGAPFKRGNTTPFKRHFAPPPICPLLSSKILWEVQSKLVSKPFERESRQGLAQKQKTKTAFWRSHISVAARSALFAEGIASVCPEHFLSRAFSSGSLLDRYDAPQLRDLLRAVTCEPCEPFGHRRRPWS
eukprot:1180971-Prorocentrum_minimum.AAC.6